LTYQEIDAQANRLAQALLDHGVQRGDRVELRYKGARIGTVLRSKDGIKPLIVSPGHRVSQDRAVALVLACGRGYKLPEPTRWADRIASRRDR